MEIQPIFTQAYLEEREREAVKSSSSAAIVKRTELVYKFCDCSQVEEEFKNLPKQFAALSTDVVEIRLSLDHLKQLLKRELRVEKDMKDFLAQEEDNLLQLKNEYADEMDYMSARLQQLRQWEKEKLPDKIMQAIQFTLETLVKTGDVISTKDMVENLQKSDLFNMLVEHLVLAKLLKLEDLAEKMTDKLLEKANETVREIFGEEDEEEEKEKEEESKSKILTSFTYEVVKK